jgi:hypothetical protein
MTRPAPIVATILLSLPLLYVGSYYCVVDTDLAGFAPCTGPATPPYRIWPHFAGQFYWPVEQVDRKLRPGAFEDSLSKIIRTSTEPVPWDDSKNQIP